jgi:gamma-glutamyl-gamma-aminobutyrate hydrolase PuuD
MKFINRQFNAVPIRIPLRFMFMMRCRAIVCSQYEQEFEQLIEMCDGFLFTGGHDISPLYWTNR